MSPAQTRFIICLVFLVLLGVYVCTGQQRPPSRRKGEKVDENIPPPTAKDYKTYEDRSLHVQNPNTAEQQAENQEIHGQVERAQSVDEDQVVDRLLQEEEREEPDVFGERVRRKGSERNYPYTYLMDIQLMALDHPAKRLRQGEATKTDSCDKVRGVPGSLRNGDIMYAPINSFYTKYTEAYGIPIIGSKYVTDEGLKRACYTAKAMLASNYNIRNAFYKFYGRIALIADNEQQTSLYEYRNWDKAYWNARVRGLGPSTTIPLSSAGDDNQRCKAGDRYFDQDILVHELGHGVHTLASRYVIPGFQQRLEAAYKYNVVVKKRWAGTYAAKNANEYFAVGSQFYFNSFRGSSYEKFNVFNQRTLRAYDKDLTDILDEVYSCFKGNNKYVHRCSWKSCRLKDFTLKYGSTFRTKSKCEVIKTSTNRDTPGKCARFTCYHLGNVFNWKNSECHALNCKYVKNELDFEMDRNIAMSTGFEVYYRNSVPKMRVPETSDIMKKHCTKRDSEISCKIPKDERKIHPTFVKESVCTDIGGCYTKKKCHYPSQKCSNSYMICPELSVKGECKRNWPFMYRNCATACDKCKSRLKYTDEEINAVCQDKAEYCPDWEEIGECVRNPVYMKRNCAASCGVCKIPKARHK